MVTLTERTIMKSRSGVYSDTAENRRKHRVGQKYGAEKQSDDGEKTEKKETDPAKELEAVNKVIAAINEGKLNLPAAEVMKLSEKKQKLEAAKNQAEKINAGVKANEEKKNAEEAKETSKKINEAQKKKAEKKEESSSKKYAEMDIKEAKKELLGKEITFKKYFFDGVDSYKDAVGKINQVRLYGKEKQPVLAADFPNGDSIQISLKQLDERKASNYEIGFDEKAGEVKSDKKGTSQESSDTDKEDLREARRKLSYLQDNEERLIKRDGKEKYDERLKQAKDEVAELKGEKPKEEKKPEAKSGEKEELDEDGELVTITNDKEKFERYRIFRDLHAARMKRGTSPTLSKMGYLKNSGDVNQKGNEKYYELQKEFGDKKYAFKEETQEQKGEKKTDKASDPIYQVQQKKKEASKKYDSKREEARQKYDKEADEIRSEIDKLYESDHPDAAKKRKELWNTLKEKTNKYDAETSRLKDEYEAEYKKLDEAEDKLYDQRQKEETSKEVKESFTRVKFEDVPNSGKVNLKKYLSEKVRKGVDEKWSNIKNIPTDNLKKMEKGLVNDLNKNFEAIKKSQRAELLYSIMKVKGELERRGKESQKKE